MKMAISTVNTVFFNLRHNFLDITITRCTRYVFRRDRAILGRLSKILGAVVHVEKYLRNCDLKR